MVSLNGPENLPRQELTGTHGSLRTDPPLAATRTAGDWQRHRQRHASGGLWRAIDIDRMS